MTPAVRENDSSACSMSWSGRPPARSAAEWQVDHGIRTAADVDDRMGERLVHRDRALAEPGDPGSIAERLGERRAEDERDVLDRVVLVDLEVAVGADGEIEQAMVREGAEQVIVEPDARVDRPVALAIEPERDRDVGLRGGPGDRHATALARTDLDGAERRGHPVASVLSVAATAMSRSFSCGSRTVRRRWSASG